MHINIYAREHTHLHGGTMWSKLHRFPTSKEIPLHLIAELEIKVEVLNH